jgi:hypothetical protein
VLTFGSRRQAVLSDRYMRSLLGIGYEIGHFLARRTGELSAPTLTPRELQVLQLPHPLTVSRNASAVGRQSSAWSPEMMSAY